jgi:formylglycine-generating enzyme required for sulfatase activity
MARWGKWLLVVALVLLISGCGGGSSDRSSGAAGKGSADGTPAATFTTVKIVPTDTPVPPPTLAPTPSPTRASTPAAEAATPEEEAETGTEAEPEPEAEAQPEAEEMEDSGMVAIPAGEFVMGSGQGDEEPAHTVFADAFEIDVSEVTNAEFAQFVEETGYQTDAEKSGDPSPWRAYFQNGKDRYPVVKVSWNDAQAYCDWAGKRLPTEVEWEKAARGTDERVYPWGDEWDVAKVNSKESGFRGPVTVGSFSEGVSPYGAMDMGGNVWEWTDSWYQGYPQTTFNSNYFGETYKVLRGGGWFSEQEQVRTTKRNANSPGAANDDIGFRCVR